MEAAPNRAPQSALPGVGSSPPLNVIRAALSLYRDRPKDRAPLVLKTRAPAPTRRPA